MIYSFIFFSTPKVPFNVPFYCDKQFYWEHLDISLSKLLERTRKCAIAARQSVPLTLQRSPVRFPISPVNETLGSELEDTLQGCANSKSLEQDQLYLWLQASGHTVLCLRRTNSSFIYFSHPRGTPVKECMGKDQAEKQKNPCPMSRKDWRARACRHLISSSQILPASVSMWHPDMKFSHNCFSGTDNFIGIRLRSSAFSSLVLPTKKQEYSPNYPHLNFSLILVLPPFVFRIELSSYPFWISKYCIEQWFLTWVLNLAHDCIQILFGSVLPVCTCK